MYLRKKINGYVVVGARYGDEGKGLMVDYVSKDTGNVLNIKANGGSQAGHTVCTLDKLDMIPYKHWVFHSIGSATLRNPLAVTYLSKYFVLDIERLLEEKKHLELIYNIDAKVVIDKQCGIILPIDYLINQLLEDTRTKRHGSCGLGLYEQFNRSNKNIQFKVDDIIKCKDKEQLYGLMMDIQTVYYTLRKPEINKELKKSGCEILEDEWECLFGKIKKNTEKLVERIDKDMGWIYGCEQPEWSTLNVSMYNNISVVDGLQNEIKEIYQSVVWECGQGLELDKNNKENYPNLTPSNTGTKNIIDMINEYGIEDIFNKIEVIYVSRSYDTKHGAGNFETEKESIVSDFGLYDRTNQENYYQGSLRYGTLNMGRMKQLVIGDFYNMYETFKNRINISGAIAITHLDQTNGLILGKSANYSCEAIQSSAWIEGVCTYYSYGEKADDVIYISCD